MAKKTKSNPSLEDLFTDPEQLKRMNDHLYSRKPLLEAGGPFAEPLPTTFYPLPTPKCGSSVTPTARGATTFYLLPSTHSKVRQ